MTLGAHVMLDSQLLPAGMPAFAATYALIIVVPGPIALTTGGVAAFHGFERTVPLLVGIGVGTAALTAAAAWGAVHLASALSVPATQAIGAAVLVWLAWRLLRFTPSEVTNATVSSSGLQMALFAQGAIIAFLAPQSAMLFAVAFMGLFLTIREADDVVAVAALTTLMSVTWYTLIAMLFSHPVVRSAAARFHCVIRRAAAAGLALMALLLTLSMSTWEWPL